MTAQGQPVPPQQPPQQAPQGPQVTPGMPPPARMAPPPETGTPEQRVDHVMRQLPPHLQTPEWANVVYYLLLEAEANVGGIAESVAGHIENLTRLRTLPEPLWPIPADPRNIGPLVFDLVPTSDEYRAKCFSETVHELMPEGEAVVTPAPSNGAGHPDVGDPPADARVVTAADAPVPPAETH